MRQAGRYLPEYRALRREVSGFLALCFDPARASAVTLQPVERFDLDAAILFSDILVIPHALGRRVDFVEGEGPQLDPIVSAEIGGLNKSGIAERLAPVLETLALVRAKLSPAKSLIGFCGAPWTVATYMIAGHGTPDQGPARAWAKAAPRDLEALTDSLVEASVEWLVAQIRAGADVVQIFDTWAGVLVGEDFERWCVQPTREIVMAVKASVPEARIIGFPKGIGARLDRYVGETGVDGVSLDSTVSLDLARRLQTSVAVQGNLDPQTLLAGGAELDTAVDRIVAALSGGPFVFNLGHGVLQQTPVENVARVVERVRR